MFKGRDDEVELLLDAIDGGTHTTVFGLQRMGKTSLVEEVIEDRLSQFPGLKESVLFAKVDFQRLGSEYPTYKDVFHAIVIAVSDVLASSGRGRRVEGLRGAIDAFFDSAGRYERGNEGANSSNSRKSWAGSPRRRDGRSSSSSTSSRRSARP